MNEQIRKLARQEHLAWNLREATTTKEDLRAKNKAWRISLEHLQSAKRAAGIVVGSMPT